MYNVLWLLYHPFLTWSQFGLLPVGLHLQPVAVSCSQVTANFVADFQQKTPIGKLDLLNDHHNIVIKSSVTQHMSAMTCVGNSCPNGGVTQGLPLCTQNYSWLACVYVKASGVCRNIQKLLAKSDVQSGNKGKKNIHKVTGEASC